MGGGSNPFWPIKKISGFYLLYGFFLFFVGEFWVGKRLPIFFKKIEVKVALWVFLTLRVCVHLHPSFPYDYPTFPLPPLQCPCRNTNPV